jgi:hypothetical protein
VPEVSTRSRSTMSLSTVMSSITVRWSRSVLKSYDGVVEPLGHASFGEAVPVPGGHLELAFGGHGGRHKAVWWTRRSPQAGAEPNGPSLMHRNTGRNIFLVLLTISNRLVHQGGLSLVHQGGARWPISAWLSGPSDRSGAGLLARPHPAPAHSTRERRTEVGRSDWPCARPETESCVDRFQKIKEKSASHEASRRSPARLFSQKQR